MTAYLSDEELEQSKNSLQKLRECLNNVLFGQEMLVDNIIVALVAGGHVLLEGLPGLGKTELAKGLAQAVELEMKRIQFTPDLLPGDITGTPVLQENAQGREFVFQPGPIFTNLLLADEINQASPKTQSALLEAMQEQRVTVMGESHTLPQPFFVLATQNPIELEGTYPLPEAQLDRFLFKLNVYRNQLNVLEKIVQHREIGVELQIPQVLSREELHSLMAHARRIYLPDVVANYIARLVDATHRGQSKAAEAIKYGASPRAALGLAASARVRGLLDGRINASFEDVKETAKPVLGHRIILEYTAKLEGKTSDNVIEMLLEEVLFQNHDLPKTLAPGGAPSP